MYRILFYRICRLILVVCVMAISFGWSNPSSAASPLLGVACGLILGTLPLLAVFALVGSLLRRRFFCNFGCPLGLAQDATVWIRRRLFFLPQGKRVRAIPDLKYALLILCVAGISRLIPVSLIWLDPQALFNSTIISSQEPGFVKGTVIWTPGLVLVPGIVLLSFLAAPKFWCMKLCPTGALQEILYLPTRTVKSVVTNVKKKQRVNLLAFRRFLNGWSIVQNGLGLLAAIAWGLAESGKTKNALAKDGLANSGASDAQTTAQPAGDPARETAGETTRETAAMETERTSPGSDVAMGEEADSGTKSARWAIQDDWKFPPGAIAVREEFIALCVRCENCIGNCPTGLIQPIDFDTSSACWGAPRLQYIQPDGNYAYCDENCNRCTLACPTDALKILTVEEKKEWKLGRAELEFGLCRLFWEKECRICLRECPQKAIEFRWSEEEYLNIPVINIDLCNGCGRCAAFCPGDNYWELEKSDPPPRRKALKIV